MSSLCMEPYAGQDTRNNNARVEDIDLTRDGNLGTNLIHVGLCYARQKASRFGIVDEKPFVS